MTMSAPGKHSSLDWGANQSNFVDSGDLREHASSAPACAEALVDGKLSLQASMLANEKEPLHTGKWTEEEMAYAEGLIDEFKAGNLALPDGTSLRQFLAKMLNCSPKRISKRYEGNNYSKGRKFYVKSTEKLHPVEAQARRKKLNDLEKQYKQKLLHLKMPHLLLASRTADLQGEKPQKGLVVNNPGNIGGPGGRLTGAVPDGNPAPIAFAGLPASIFDSARSGIGLSSLRMDPASLLNHASLTSNLSAQLTTQRLASTDAGLTDASALSRLADDAGTLALLSQLSSQQRETERLSALLAAQRGLSSSSELGANPLVVQAGLLGSTSILGERASPFVGNLSPFSHVARQQQPLDRDVSQQRLQQLLRAEQARTVAQHSIGLQARASLPANNLAARPVAALPSPSAARLQSTIPSDQLQSLLQWKLQQEANVDQGVGAGRGQKRRASDSNTAADSVTNSPSGSCRRRLAGPGDNERG